VKLEEYAPSGHRPQIVESTEPGVWVAVCGSCSARDGAWATFCATWDAGTPKVLFSSQAIADRLESVFFELVRPAEDFEPEDMEEETP
jgi:hypothetical protein